MRFIHQKSCCALSMQIWQPFKWDIYNLLPSKKSPKGKVIELTDVGKLWGENLFVIYRILSLTTTNIKLLSSCDSIISKLVISMQSFSIRCVYIVQRNSTIDHMNYSPKCWSRNCVPKHCLRNVSMQYSNFRLSLKRKSAI